MLKGKGFFIWNIPNTEGGEVDSIVARAKEADLTHLLIKIADGIDPFNLDGDGNDLVPPLVEALHTEGIQAWGWHFVYGDEPIEEAQIATQRVGQTGVVGYVIDAESHYKQPGKEVAALAFMETLRSQLPVFPVGLSTYRYPTVHPELPWEAFLTKCNFAMPQVYWVFADNPREQLNRTINEYRAITSLPIIPTGAAFSEGGWTPALSEVREFLDTARDNFLSAANFWEWGAARGLPGMWETVADYFWPVAEQPQPSGPPVVRARVWANTLNVRSGPGSEHPVVGSLKFGTRVTVYTLHRAWVKISPDQEQWVYSFYLERFE